MTYLLGIDIGSTTAKAVLLKDGVTVYEKYARHFSKVREKTAELIAEIEKLTGDEKLRIAISGSAGLGLAEGIGIAFTQEVFATGEVVKKLVPDASCVIELGGEDAKIIFFDGGVDERMNGSCAGGTGAFIDQMATLLDLTPDQMDELSLQHQRLYPIASRCGVFAKTDIQPLLNQGANKADVAASIYQAVVNQTIAGLAQGRRIKGKVLFLGGPLYYCKGLRQRFTETLGLAEEDAIFPDYARYAVAMGAAIYAEKSGSTVTAAELMKKIRQTKENAVSANRLPPLFASQEEYRAFKTRHSLSTVPKINIEEYSGKAYLGIDCGSTTTKLVLISANREILYSYYASNKGNPVEVVKDELTKIYGLIKDRIEICGCAVTGYGEELIKHAFGADAGVVETIAHYTAAKHFCPDVDFILDIGGQDIKCFKIRGGAIDSIMLNEACSSGCGSFLETFAKSMGCSIAEFAEKGIFGNNPVNLGSRCTVFMNSSVKQSQKEGAATEDISAGLSVSVVKNALYKVIRATSPDELGEKVVVQGGTFLNDAVLRSFEKELGKEVIRPDIAGLMGAFGAAIYAERFTKSGLMDAEGLKAFTHQAKSTVCRGCTNRCHLTINSFGGGKRLISGNRCEKGAGGGESFKPLPNLYEFKRNYLTSLPHGDGDKGVIGLPLALGMFELLPLWNGIFTSLGFKTVVSSLSTRATYEKGQFSIPSDTACYPAKIMHGHIEELIDAGVDAVFYPCLSYNINEKVSDNHYNCPVVAYYSELINGNMDIGERTRFLYPYLTVNNKRELARELGECLAPFGHFSSTKLRSAVSKGFKAYNDYMAAVKKEGEAALARARAEGKRIMILSGRPYHIDPEISHGIDQLANTLGFAVVSEDSVCHLTTPPKSVAVLNQWTYHARLYRAAKYATENEDAQLVQLVSFGCGVDAITTDEVRSILEDGGKYYTQLKIDEITNLGAVKIRLRSLIGALEEKEANGKK
ncbi:MAG: 2-hydroxyglutaryl-CoA dehydratase [Ruminococcaceae bacterium]|nr:2-hydroxyglutaryl-CoA dehydratase [Oscillospiraceae bacterium]